MNAPALRRARSFSAISSAVVTAAALLGFLIGLGRRSGVAWRPLNAAAHAIIGPHADDVWNFATDVTPLGGAVVLASSAVAAWLATTLASILPVRSAALLSSAMVALLGYQLHVHVATRGSGGLAALLSTGELRAMYVVLAVALVAGMRLAFSPGAGEAGHHS